MAEKVVMDLKEEVDKLIAECEAERLRILSRKLQDISDLIAVDILQNNLLLDGMDQLIVQRLGTSFLRSKENKEALKKINKILDRINERNGITQRSLEEKILEFRKKIKTEGENKKSD